MRFSEVLDIMGRQVIVRTPRHRNLTGEITKRRKNGTNSGVDLILDVSMEFGKPLYIVYRHWRYEDMTLLREENKKPIIAGMPSSLIGQEEYFEVKPAKL